MKYKINADIANRAKNTIVDNRSLAGAFKVWAVSRWLDPEGRGAVNKALLKSTLSAFGVRKRSSQRWIKSAYQAGFFTAEKKTDLVWYRSPLELARILKHPKKLLNPVYLESPLQLFEEGWEVVIFDCLIAGLQNGRIDGAKIARATIEDYSGIAHSTQRSYLTRGKTRTVRNVIILDENGQGAYLESLGPVRVWGKRVVRVTSSTHYNPYKIAPRGRVKLYNRSLVNVGQGKRRFYRKWIGAIKNDGYYLARHFRCTNYYKLAGGNA